MTKSFKEHHYLTVAAPSSGAGKTTVSIGLMALFSKLGLSVQPFKVGPDYIDPKYHEAVTENISYNLDGWLMSKGYVENLFSRESMRHDISIIEGVMGLYDGFSGTSEEGSTAEIAKWLNSPVLLVVDARAAARSVAALVKGFELFDGAADISGVIVNKVGSRQHFKMVEDAITYYCNAKVIGYLPSDEKLYLPSRHLGLVSSAYNTVTPVFLKQLISNMESHLDIDLILELSKKKICMTDKDRYDTAEQYRFHIQKKKRFSIAVAFDDAFCFYYHDNFRIIEDAGIRICFFSPLRDASLPGYTDFIYIGGGYPELFAHRLHTNYSIRSQIKRFAEHGGGIYAECGGLMYLSKRLISIDKKEFLMSGVLPCTSVMTKKRMAMGYVSVCITKDCYLGKKGDIVRGHEYHYSDLIDMPEYIERKYILKKKGKTKKTEGYSYKNVLASYVHIHFGNNPEIVQRFLG